MSELESKMPHFRFLEIYDFEELMERFPEAHPRVIKAVDCFYEVHHIADSKSEEMILRYFVKDETQEDGRDYLPPLHVWQRMFFAPPVGMGTQLLTSDKLLLPVTIINGENEEDVLEVYNDGIVSFRTDHDRDKILHVLNWAKSCTGQDFFVTLGAAIYNAYIKANVKGGASEYLGDKPQP